MIDLSKIKTNSIIICPSNTKNLLIKEYSKNFPYLQLKFLSKKEVMDGFYFSYDLRALYYMHKTYNISYTNCEEILNNLINIKPANEELTILYNYYLDLKKENLLIVNPIFERLFINKNVYIYNYSHDDIELSSTLKEHNIEFEYIQESKNEHLHNVIKFKTIEEEVLYTFNKIALLIKNNVSLNNIYIYKYGSEYNLLIDKYAHYYKLNIETDEGIKLDKTVIYKEYLNLLNDNDPIKAFELLKNQNINNTDLFLKKLSSILVDILELNIESVEEFVELLNYKASNKNVINERYKESIKICNYDTPLGDNDFVFIMGFSLDSFPIIHKDIELINDESKSIINKNTSIIKNKIEKEKLIEFIKNTKNLTISYKEKLGKKEYYPSLIINELNMTTVEEIIDNNRYSLDFARYEIAKYKDLYANYGIKNEYYDVFTSEELEYKKFDHKYKQINKEKLSDKVNLSFSSIDNYNHCHFKYFLNKILKINDFETTLSIELGKLFHKILEETTDGNFEFSNFQEYINENFPTCKDKFFVELNINQIIEVLNKNKDLYDHTMFKEVKAEHELFYRPSNDPNSSLYGKIDRIMFDNNNKNLLLTDYKTYDLTFKPEKNEFGLDLQLPLYYLLLRKNYDYNVVGVYLQNILINPHKENLHPYYLNGLTNSNLDAIKRFDLYLGTTDGEGNEIKESKFIKGVKITKDGELSRQSSSVVDQDFFDKLLKDSEIQFKKAVELIRNGDFKISPTRYKKENLPCEKCNFKDICFSKSSDIVTVGGDEIVEEDIHAI